MVSRKDDEFSVWDMDDGDVDDIIDEDEGSDTRPSKKRAVGRTPGRISRKDPQKQRPKGEPKGKDAGSKGFLRSKPFVWTMRIFVVIAVLLLLFLPLEPLERLREDTGMNDLKDLLRPFRQFPEWVEANLSVQYDLRIKDGTADETRIKTAIPFDIMDPNSTFRIQDVDRVSLVPGPTEGLPDYNADKNIVSGWKLIDQRGDFRFTAEFSVRLYSHQWDITLEESGTLDDIPENFTSQYLDDEWVVNDQDGRPIDKDQDGEPDYYRYHPSAPILKRTALAITEDESTVLGKVKSIYQWIEDHFNYTTNDQRERDQQKYGSWPKYPLGTLSEWYGDCDDQSLLMASLCRAVGIPAWLEIGYLYDPIAKSWGGHGWFNVVIPLKDTDPVIAPIDPVNHEFLFRDPYRITDWIDTGGDIIDEDGEIVYNLDYYYNYFKVKKNNFVDVNVKMSTISIRYEDHGRIKQYVDQELKPGNLPGSEEGLGQMPFPLITVMAAAAIPIFLGRKRL
jgi:hypothetical protein